MSDIKEKIKEFSEIAASVPENLQAICFEILLRDHLASISTERKPPRTEASDASDTSTIKAAEESTKEHADIAGSDLHVKARKFMEKYSVSLNEINNLFYKEGQEILPLYEDLKTTRMAEAQIRVALLQALRNALVTGEFTAQVEAIRVECRDRKSYDQANFAATFRNNGKPGSEQSFR